MASSPSYNLHAAAKKAGIRLIPATRLDLDDGPSLLAFPKNIHAYSQISNLLTTGNLRTEKGKCLLYKADVYAHSRDTLFVVVPPELNAVFDFDADFKEQLHEYLSR